MILDEVMHLVSGGSLFGLTGGMGSNDRIHVYAERRFVFAPYYNHNTFFKFQFIKKIIRIDESLAFRSA